MTNCVGDDLSLIPKSRCAFCISHEPQQHRRDCSFRRGPARAFSASDRTATRKIQATFFQVISPFLKTGSGLERQITSVRAGLKSLEELERDNAD